MLTQLHMVMCVCVQWGWVRVYLRCVELILVACCEHMLCVCVSVCMCVHSCVRACACTYIGVCSVYALLYS